MEAKYFVRGDVGVLNITAHPATFKKWWSEKCRSSVTCSAVKYCNVRRAFGLYVIDGPVDAVNFIYVTSTSQFN